MDTGTREPIEWSGQPGVHWAELLATMGTLVHAFREAMVPALQQLVVAAGRWQGLVSPLVYPRLRAVYEAAGSPYGPDDASMWRWWGEVAAVVREMAHEQRERAWQASLAEVRRRLEARRPG